MEEEEEGRKERSLQLCFKAKRARKEDFDRKVSVCRSTYELKFVLKNFLTVSGIEPTTSCFAKGREGK